MYTSAADKLHHQHLRCRHFDDSLVLTPDKFTELLCCHLCVIQCQVGNVCGILSSAYVASLCHPHRRHAAV